MPVSTVQGSPVSASVFCIHGTPGDRRFFNSLLTFAPADVRVVALDLPDHGVARDLEALDTTPFEDFLTASIRSVGHPVTVVGHSFGAHLAARVLAGLEQLVDRAVFIGGFAALPPAMREGRARLGDQIASGALGPGPLEELAVDLFLGGEGSHDDAALIRAMMRDNSLARVVRSCQRVARLATWDAPPFATPTLVLHAREDRAVPFEVGSALAACGTNTRLVPLEGAAHCPQLTRAAEIAPLVFGTAVRAHRTPG